MSESLTPEMPNPILSVGTQVVTKIEKRNRKGELVCPQGAVGVVIEAPGDNLHSYKVGLPDGKVVAYRRQHLAIRKHFQEEGLNRVVGTSTPEDARLYRYVIYRCVVGSRAYGLQQEGSDTDRRGFYLPPANLHWSLYGVPEQLENKESEECYWEIQKFLNMALKANPNVLECLYSPLVEFAGPLAEELLAIREGFLSRLIYQTYNGYVLSQFKKLEQDRRNRGEIRTKHAMHLIRLLLSGITVLKEGVLPVKVEEQYRKPLLAIRRGEIEWEEVNRWRLELHRDFEAAFRATRLPERPSYEKANAFLLHARHEALQIE